MIGQTYGRLTILEVNERHRARCLCSCGNEKWLSKYDVIKGHTKSCGCASNQMRAKAKTTHGMRDTPTYKTWAEMRQRCDNPNKWQYKHYGGRGIGYDRRWSSFENFYADMGERPDGMTLDRIDHDGNYGPTNCRWATKVQQMRNTSTNRMLRFGGEEKTLAEWSEITGLKVGTIWARLEVFGWSIEKTLTTKLQHARAERI